jgi:hypothetical protein
MTFNTSKPENGGNGKGPRKRNEQVPDVGVIGDPQGVSEILCVRSS